MSAFWVLRPKADILVSVNSRRTELRPCPPYSSVYVHNESCRQKLTNTEPNPRAPSSMIA